MLSDRAIMAEKANDIAELSLQQNRVLERKQRSSVFSAPYHTDPLRKGLPKTRDPKALQSLGQTPHCLYPKSLRLNQPSISQGP